MMKIALDEIPPFSMRVSSLMLGVFTLTSLSLLQGRSLRPPPPRTFAHLCAASFFNIVAFSVLTPFAQISAATSRVAIVVYTMPIWATLMALPILGERLNTVRALALALCVAGMSVLIYPLATLGIPTGIYLQPAPQSAGLLAPSISNGRRSMVIRWLRPCGSSSSE